MYPQKIREKERKRKRKRERKKKFKIRIRDRKQTEVSLSLVPLALFPPCLVLSRTTVFPPPDVQEDVRL